MESAFHRDGTPILVKGKLHSYKDVTFRSLIFLPRTRFPAVLTLFGVLFHAISIVLSFYFLSVIFNAKKIVHLQFR